MLSRVISSLAQCKFTQRRRSKNGPRRRSWDGNDRRPPIAVIGVSRRFVQNCTLSRKGKEIKTFHKRSFAHGSGGQRNFSDFSFQNPLSKSASKAIRIRSAPVGRRGSAGKKIRKNRKTKARRGK